MTTWTVVIIALVVYVAGSLVIYIFSKDDTPDIVTKRDMYTREFMANEYTNRKIKKIEDYLGIVWMNDPVGYVKRNQEEE